MPNATSDRVEALVREARADLATIDGGKELVGCDGARLRAILTRLVEENAALSVALGPEPTLPPELLGTWPGRCVQRAFVKGAKWWEFKSTGGTMWQSDQRVAEAEAVRRYGDPSAATPAASEP